MRIPVIGLVDVAEATTWTGDPTVEPVAGDLIVTPANEAATSESVQQSRRTACLKDLSRETLTRCARV